MTLKRNVALEGLYNLIILATIFHELPYIFNQVEDDIIFQDRSFFSECIHEHPSMAMTLSAGLTPAPNAVMDISFMAHLYYIHNLKGRKEQNNKKRFY